MPAFERADEVPPHQNHTPRHGARRVRDCGLASSQVHWSRRLQHSPHTGRLESQGSHFERPHAIASLSLPMHRNLTCELPVVLPCLGSVQPNPPPHGFLPCCKVHMPREHSINRKLVVVGYPEQVDVAVRHVKRTLKVRDAGWCVVRQVGRASAPAVSWRYALVPTRCGCCWHCCAMLYSRTLWMRPTSQKTTTVTATETRTTHRMSRGWTSSSTIDDKCTLCSRGIPFVFGVLLRGVGVERGAVGRHPSAQ